MQVHEQYLIHDFVSIVSAVGGGLGLFLGFSCFSIVSQVAKGLHKVMPLKKNAEKKASEEDSENRVTLS